MTGSLPLRGIKILDLSRVLAGPLCGMMLGDLGADVIKVERPGIGDESRGWGPPFDDRGESAYFLSANRNKLSIGLDLDSNVDHTFLLSLIGDADVVLENFKPGTLEKRGTSATKLLDMHPDLIWCTISGFGAASPRLGYDFVVQAEAGWMSITGEAEGAPMKTGVALADVLAGKDATIAILAALARRRRTHAGGVAAPDPATRHLRISLMGSATSALINVAQNALVSGDPPKRWGNAHANLVPYQLFDARDRPMVVAVGNDSQWLALCKALDLPDLLRDPDLRTNAGRLANRGAVVRAIAQRLLERTADEWMDLLAAAGVPSGKVRSVPEVLEEANASPIMGVGSSVGGMNRLPPPRLDEHGALIRAHKWGVFDRLPAP